MKKFLLVLAIMAGLLGTGGMFSPVIAANAEEWQSCSKHPDFPDPQANTCRVAIYGVAATVAHFSPDLEYSGRLVQSIYIYLDGQRYVEMGWFQERGGFPLGYGDRYVFVRYSDTTTGGQATHGDWSINSWPTGPVTLQIYQTPGSLGTFRFRYKQGYFTGGSSWVNLPPLNPPGSWDRGYAKANQETLQEGDDFGYYHEELRIQNANGDLLWGGAYGFTKLSDGSQRFYATYPNSGFNIYYWCVINDHSAPAC